MISAASVGGFALIALGIVMTPGPNMAYVVSRSVSQGRAAGLLSLAGIAGGLLVYMLMAAFGITGLVLGVPGVFEGLQLVGALYLGFLAWKAVRPGGVSPFDVKDLPPDSPKRLLLMGLMTSLLNPKVVVLYVALLPQFVEPERGYIMGQTLTLGFIHIVLAVLGNGVYAVGASGIARFLRARPAWLLAQRYAMGLLLAFFAVRMVAEIAHEQFQRHAAESQAAAATLPQQTPLTESQSSAPIGTAAQPTKH